MDLCECYSHHWYGIWRILLRNYWTFQGIKVFHLQILRNDDIVPTVLSFQMRIQSKYSFIISYVPLNATKSFNAKRSVRNGPNLPYECNLLMLYVCNMHVVDTSNVNYERFHNRFEHTHTQLLISFFVVVAVPFCIILSVLWLEPRTTAFVRLENVNLNA